MGSIVSSIVRSIVSGVVAQGSGAVVEEPAEFITNGSFATADNWAIPAGGWTIGSGVATNTISGNARKIQQDFGSLVQPLISGRNYVLSFTCDNTVGVTNFNVWIDTGALTNNIYSDMPVTGTVTIPFTASDNATTVAHAAGTAEPTGIIIDNISLAPA